jgi:phenylpropionate dioxygenase-like ring-hydroxylating dioxygenase large terminal subunit
MSALESVSNAFDNEVLVATIDGRYNWKLAYENLRDSLHPRFVHTTSLNMDVDFDASVSASLMEQDRGGGDVPLTQLSFGGPEGTPRRSHELPFHSTIERWGNNDSYFNWLLYPSTHIVSPDGGHLFSIEHHVPLAPDRTRMIAYFMTGKKKRASTDVSSVLWAYAQGAKVILDEDIHVMEEAQAGLAAGAPTATVGDVEIRNRLTDRWYLKRMNTDGLSYE